MNHLARAQYYKTFFRIIRQIFRIFRQIFRTSRNISSKKIFDQKNCNEFFSRHRQFLSTAFLLRNICQICRMIRKKSFIVLTPGRYLATLPCPCLLSGSDGSFHINKHDNTGFRSNSHMRLYVQSLLEICKR